MSDKRREDGRLRDALLDGDESALEQFYERYFSRLYRYAYYRVGHDHHHAEEVVNDTFMEALNQLERFDPERGSMEAWLITLSRNRIRSCNAAMKRPLEHEASLSMLEGEAETIFADLREVSLQEAALENEELRDAIGLAMGSLPEEYSSLLEMKYIKDMSVRDIAGVIEKTEKAVESKLTRARGAFRQLFASLMGPEGLSI
ncbi:MAG: RNA polymerase sigma factor [Planctomycetota bacterium]|jgi:RNA polymerase sigma-70 factor (ECF subfamily)